MTIKNKVGRPKGDSQAREQLLLAATELFVSLDYDKVSIRMIANKAEVDAALIRYYFGSKAQLFGEMLNSVAKPVFATLDKASRDFDADDLGRLMRSYYQTMVENPYFPKLIFKLSNTPKEHESAQQLQHMIDNMGRFKSKHLFDQLLSNNVLLDDVDTELAQLSFLSLMVFPFLIPERLLQANQIALSKAKFLKLADHNIQLLQRGLFKHKGTDS
ncbi:MULTISPECIES: TetR/AcrR family transcriptional regulator [unclassified Agarivorans]|uniref:TetR/AcrR family transcriptional regulator n=1 Tax=unclassified Agarivorans TaxID=2636026 RepID=UPI0026E44F12|nr:MULTISPECIES: TetR/AcrR family transcriptional regulator [unclassified Agarivorans]MDO6685053.1 TetR/AcrR family transcriptional regulator [Agarivorans sp. 3_MG-2023]MDO6717389.1 TetR/AcrR family transcriptional regulator [Agarivorans sp. 2_MG-2023]MDO6765298.1 TetR/AcrR family transcriptional regulator [Agarivorans sp. 1_MG-2023]